MREGGVLSEAPDDRLSPEGAINLLVIYTYTLIYGHGDPCTCNWGAERALSLLGGRVRNQTMPTASSNNAEGCVRTAVVVQRQVGQLVGRHCGRFSPLIRCDEKIRSQRVRMAWGGRGPGLLRRDPLQGVECTGGSLPHALGSQAKRKHAILPRTVSVVRV